jgi:hypothetical protein
VSPGQKGLLAGTASLAALQLIQPDSVSADQSSASMPVGATILPTCTASTGQVGIAGARVIDEDVSVDCSSDGSWTITVSEEKRAPSSRPDPSAGPQTVVTVVY